MTENKVWLQYRPEYSGHIEQPWSWEYLYESHIDSFLATQEDKHVMDIYFTGFRYETHSRLPVEFVPEIIEIAQQKREIHEKALHDLDMIMKNLASS